MAMLFERKKRTGVSEWLATNSVERGGFQHTARPGVWVDDDEDDGDVRWVPDRAGPDTRPIGWALDFDYDGKHLAEFVVACCEMMTGFPTYRLMGRHRPPATDAVMRYRVDRSVLYRVYSGWAKKPVDEERFYHSFRAAGAVEASYGGKLMFVGIRIRPEFEPKKASRTGVSAAEFEKLMKRVDRLERILFDDLI